MAVYAQDPRQTTWSIPQKYSSEPSYRYEQLRGENDEIRLLRVHTAESFDDPLILDIYHASLDSQPAYAALSYTWGPPVFEHIVYLNQTLFNVTRSLDHALRSFRKTGEQVIWADAICIDQSNTDERNQQVRLMQKIYERAKFVFVSLGEGEENAPLAINLMKKSYDAAEKVRRLKEANMPFEESNIDTTFPEWSAFNSLLLSPWIMRTWIVQEATSCPDTRIMYAGEVLPFQALLDTVPIAAAIRSSCSDVTGGRNSNFENPEYAHFQENLLDIEMARTSLRTLINIRKTPQTYTLLKLLRSLRPQLATDPRDKVFGVLGIATDCEQFPQPDYYQTIEDIYVNVATVTVTKPRARIGLLLAEAGLHKQRLHNLPTWVPDWSHPRNAFCFGDRIYLSERGLIFEHDLDSDSNLETPSIAHLPLLISKSPTSPIHSTLTLHGTFPDSLLALGPILQSSPGGTFSAFESFNEPSYNLIKTHHALLSSSAPLSPPDMTTPGGQAYINALSTRYADALVGNIFNHINPSTNAPSIYAGHAFEALLELSRYEHENLMGGDMRRQVTLLYKAYCRVLNSVTVGRRFCVTRRGRMGIVPGVSEVGDVVGVLDGVRGPVVLRRKRKEEEEEEEEEGFVLIGDAFVEGLEGEGGIEETVSLGEEIRKICLF